LRLNTNDALGRRLRQERLRRGLTLKQIESRVGISATHLSDIERGKCSPTVGVLDKLARALETRPALLLDTLAAPGVRVTRHGEREVVLSRCGKVRSAGVTPFCPQSKLSLLYKTYEVAPDRETRDRGHAGEELLTVLEGRLSVRIGGKEYLLEAGDSIHFKSSLPHGFRNVGETVAHVLAVTTPRFSV